MNKQCGFVYSDGQQYDNAAKISGVVAGLRCLMHVGLGGYARPAPSTPPAPTPAPTFSYVVSVDEARAPDPCWRCYYQEPGQPHTCADGARLDQQRRLLRDTERLTVDELRRQGRL